MTTLLPQPTPDDDAPGDILWPDSNVLVLRNRPVRIGTAPEQLSRFGDDVWHVRPAHRDAHTALPAIYWTGFPERLQRHFKAFFLATLDHACPVSPYGWQTPGAQISIGSFPHLLLNCRVLACWMGERGLEDLSEFNDSDLDAYLSHVLTLSHHDDRKADLIGAVRTVWLFREHLPVECRMGCGYPWPGKTANELAGITSPRSKENKRPRIADETIEALLNWAITIVEQIGQDIASAHREYKALDAGAHPSQRQFTGSRRERFTAYLDHCKRHNLALPGRETDCGIEASNHILRLIGIEKSLRSGLSDAESGLIEHSGLPIARTQPVGTITGLVNGIPWRKEPIDTGELDRLVLMVSAACFTVICYLSGMRPGEVLNLRRGCRGTDEETGELLVHGYRGKGYNRAPDAPHQTEPTRPWVVVTPVHAAIDLLERLHDLPLLFPASLVAAYEKRPPTTNARTGTSMNNDIQALITWVNTTFRRAHGQDAIPADPHGRINASRFRRTLARFIVRRPRGLIAAALQYGHLRTKVTLSYAGSPDSGWLTDLAVEQLEMVIDQIWEDAEFLEAGEHVSGPSATEYRTRLKQAVSFAGRVVATRRNVERILNTNDPAVHHGEGMTCVWKASTAACRANKIKLGLPANDMPDEGECQSTCTNLTYSDRDIEEQRLRLRRLTHSAEDPLAPKPRRERAATLAAQAAYVIKRHEQTRSRTASEAPQEDAS
ncbi:integrase [Streptomyces sp. AP-93]|uniref:integrase n=1 Tax=Streptomyces sp. AP-93 TaxID=2929048 RepID=UPI001FAE8F5F|nr:integrase [Streptomyces sp. AP-93]MCJ0869492.1 integrase [Streptomyces sp. AP-93]